MSPKEVNKMLWQLTVSNYICKNVNITLYVVAFSVDTWIVDQDVQLLAVATFYYVIKHVSKRQCAFKLK